MRILPLFLLVAFTGCTLTSVETAGLKVRRVSFLQRVEVPSLALATNGTVTLQGYANDGGGEATGVVLGTALRTFVKGTGTPLP